MRKKKKEQDLSISNFVHLLVVFNDVMVMKGFIVKLLRSDRLTVASCKTFSVPRVDKVRNIP